MEDYRWAIEDFIPSKDRESIEAQERAALALCSSRQFLPEGKRDLLEVRESGPGSGAA
jgi:hypothetical protein